MATSILSSLFQECDASSLAVNRILLGSLLLLDVIYERGLSRADLLWGQQDPFGVERCRFPLVNSLVPLSSEGMYSVYLLMVIGLLGFTLGYHYRLSITLYTLTYWYLFLLDRARWNNHSYLFGLFALQHLVNDSNRTWSLDVYFERIPNNPKVPRWQYWLLRFQIFIVYFYAGLKKLNPDWLLGYSMVNLSQTWVFTPFKILVPDYWIDYYLIHVGGFLFDLFVGFLFWHHTTLPVAFLLVAIFNLTNSQMFQIGMFPWVMLAVMPIFCEPNWPRTLAGKIFKILDKTSFKVLSSKKLKTSSSEEKMRYLSTLRLFLVLNFIVGYVLVQLVLPFAFVVLPGYTTWTTGIYGYNWDMMVHNWNHLHTTVKVKSVDQNGKIEERFIEPTAWTWSHRWAHHADMAKQFAMCVQRQMVNRFGYQNVSVYLDVWTSLNGRFAQRMYDPNVDLVTAKWDPWTTPTWVYPILYNSNHWRLKLSTNFGSFDQLVRKNQDNGSMAMFIADFPGMTIQSNFESTLFNSSINLIVFEGTLHVRLYHSKEIIKEFFLQSNTGLEIPQTSREVFIKTISDKPSYFGLLYPKLQTEENRAPKTNNSSDNKTRSFAEEVRARNHWIASARILLLGFKHLAWDLAMVAPANILFELFNPCPSCYLSWFSSSLSKVVLF